MNILEEIREITRNTWGKCQHIQTAKLEMINYYSYSVHILSCFIQGI